MEDYQYILKIEQYRQEKNARIISNPRNWLSLCGLFWLEAGDNSIGNESGNKIVLVKLGANNRAILSLDNKTISLMAGLESSFLVNGKSITTCAIQTDAGDTPDVISADCYQMMVIIRGIHTLLRVWDLESETITNFSGLKYFPVRPDYCVQAKFLQFENAKHRTTSDAIDTELESSFVGELVFIWKDVECRLEAEADGDELLINFTDLTRADSTYPAGRYLTLPTPQNEDVILDFNLAANWPCAYTPYATCPLPIRGNYLPVRIEAGEMKFHD